MVNYAKGCKELAGKIAPSALLTLILMSMLILVLEVQHIMAEPGTIIVPDDYPTIQEAVNAANAGDRVYVRANTYHEHVVMNKSLSLIGESRDTTIIDGGQKGNVIHVTADNVTIRKFTIKNGGILVEGSSNSLISGNNIKNWLIDFKEVGVGVDLSHGSFNCTVSENNIDTNYIAIYLKGSGCEVSRNNVTQNEFGVWIRGSSCNVSQNNVTHNYYGVFMNEASSGSLISNTVCSNWHGIWFGLIKPARNFVLRNNNMTDNEYNFGMEDIYYHLFVNPDIDSSNTVDGKPVYYWVNQRDKVVPSDAGFVAIINSTNIIVQNSMLTANSQGVVFAYTTNSTIRNVTATENKYHGIYLHGCSNCSIVKNNIEHNWNTHALDPAFEGKGIELYVSSNNSIYHNNFVNNQRQVVASSGYASSWDDGYPSGGNYWSDYAGNDWCSGLYQNETGSDGIGDASYVINADNEDNYPLMKPYPWDPHDIGVTRVESKSVIGQGFDLRVDVTIFNYGMFAETFNVSAYANTTIIATSTNIILPSRNSITLTFAWNTTGVAKGSYTLTIYATQVSEETYTADNTYKRLIIVTILGDVNGDGKVDGKDISVLDKYFGYCKGQPNYESDADINCDERIDGKDIAIAAKNFGQIDP